MKILNILFVAFVAWFFLTHSVIVFDEVTEAKVNIMAEQDNKEFAHFIDNLVHEEWERRNTK